MTTFFEILYWTLVVFGASALGVAVLCMLNGINPQEEFGLVEREDA